MKKLFLTLSVLTAALAMGQSQPAPVDPCQKLDTNTIKKLIVGTWVDTKDSTHIFNVTDDSVEETIIIRIDGRSSVNSSLWNYRFTDNIFSTDAVTCYSLVEYKPEYSRQEKLAINYIDAHYLLLGASGKIVYKRKN